MSWSYLNELTWAEWLDILWPADLTWSADPIWLIFGSADLSADKKMIFFQKMFLKRKHFLIFWSTDLISWSNWSAAKKWSFFLKIPWSFQLIWLISWFSRKSKQKSCTFWLIFQICDAQVLSIDLSEKYLIGLSQSIVSWSFRQIYMVSEKYLICDKYQLMELNQLK